MRRALPALRECTNTSSCDRHHFRARRWKQPSHGGTEIDRVVGAQTRLSGAGVRSNNFHAGARGRGEQQKQLIAGTTRAVSICARRSSRPSRQPEKQLLFSAPPRPREKTVHDRPQSRRIEATPRTRSSCLSSCRCTSPCLRVSVRELFQSQSKTRSRDRRLLLRHPCILTHLTGRTVRPQLLRHAQQHQATHHTHAGEYPRRRPARRIAGSVEKAADREQ